MNITTHARRIAAISALFFISTLFVSAHEITLSGKVLGAGERPLRAGNVSIFRFGALEADTTVSIGNSGGYSLTFKASSGAVKVRFTGVHHEPLDVLVMSSKPMREQLDAQLTPQRFPSSPDSVVLLDQSNNYNISSGKKLEYKNGVYSAPMPDVQDEQYAYQIVPRYALQLRSEMIPFAGTVADTFEFDGVASYRAIFGTDKKSITFDAADIPRSNTSASFRFANPVLQQQATAYSMIAGFRRAFQDSTQRDAARQQQRGSAFNDMNLAEFSERLRVSQLRDSILTLINNETNDDTRRLYYIGYIEATAETGSDQSMLEKAIRTIPPSSALWSLNPQLIYSANRNRTPEQRELYINDVLAMNTDTSVIVQTAFAELQQATLTRDLARARQMYKLLNDKFPDHPLTTSARYSLNPDRKIQVGNKIPALTFTTLEKKKITTEQQRGKYTLINCWVASSALCTNEIPVIKRAVEKFAGKLNAISINFDGNADVAQKERTRLAMTWTQCHAEKGMFGTLAKDLEITGLPRTILLSPEGSILALDSDLHGGELDKTLTQLFSKK